ncbi:hypothetical protein CAPTEDRAFT_118646 [Capitella teleta]|uniref:Uncharacterized protein n=1 Tax=Capitella teleta TaxID=283909 RepID=R7VHS5_CAPTE|nr:hypothetical protein CAPTEDRAFT_118646 [Capitella teleta]|eukprot:ELU15851.1 hypothetical protein CAPTEDRAFT_118646 [Capitella teleta]
MNPGYQQYPQQPGYGNQGGQQQQQQVVVVNQPAAQASSTGQPQNIRSWSTSLCGCCEDIGGCIYGYFCMCCLMCTVASQLGENCCVPIFLQGGTMAMRTKLRTQYGITGSICDDWCMTTCCGALAMCQMHRELKNLGR